MADYGISAFYPYLNTWDAGLLGAWGNPWGGWGQSLGGAWGAQDTSGQPQSSVGADGVTGQDRRSEGGGEGQPSQGAPSGALSGTAGVKAGELGRAFGGYAGKAATTGLATLGAASAAGAPGSIGLAANAAMGGLMNPGSIATLGGQLVGSSLGMSKPQSTLGQVAAAVPGGLLGMVNPALGIGWGLFGPMAVDAAMDATNSRKDESFKDAMEGEHGYFGGREASRDLSSLATLGGFDSIAAAAQAYGLSPADLALGLSNKDATNIGRGFNPSSGSSYGGHGQIGGPAGGARGVDAGYGPNMGGWGGLGIGNPTTYGGLAAAMGAAQRAAEAERSSALSGRSNVDATSWGGRGRGDSEGTSSLGRSTGEGLGGSRGGGYGSMGTGHD